MVAMGFASMIKLPVARPPASLPLGQIIIGTTLGQYFTSPVLRELLHQLPFIVAGALLALLLGIASGLLLKRISGCDARTAFFASLPAGAAEMAVLAERAGGRSDLVAAAQAARVMLVVVIVPPLLTWSGIHGDQSWLSLGPSAFSWRLPMALACCVIAAGVLNRLGMPNSWMIGPLMVMIAVTALGTKVSPMPAWAVNGGQLLIGCALGSRFNADFLRLAPAFLSAVTVTVCFAMGLAGLAAWGLANISDIGIGTSILALAPGGVAEMSVTAKLLQLGVPVVAAFHVARMATLLLTAGPVFRWQERYTNRHDTTC